MKHSVTPSSLKITEFGFACVLDSFESREYGLNIVKVQFSLGMHALKIPGLDQPGMAASSEGVGGS
jgi:hypothetical protein